MTIFWIVYVASDKCCCVCKKCFWKCFPTRNDVQYWVYWVDATVQREQKLWALMWLSCVFLSCLYHHARVSSYLGRYNGSPLKLTQPYIFWHDRWCCLAVKMNTAKQHPETVLLPDQAHVICSCKQILLIMRSVENPVDVIATTTK